MKNKIKDFIRDHITVIGVTVGLIVAVLIWIIAGEERLGIVSNILQVVTVVLAACAWYYTKKLLEARKKDNISIKNTDLILMISLSSTFEKGIVDDVEKYFKNENVPIDEREAIIIDGANDILSDPSNKYMNLIVDSKIKGSLHILKTQDMPDETYDMENYISEFRKCMETVSRLMEKESIGTVRIFIKAPVEMSAFMMPYFSNKRRVFMYRWVQSDATYRPMGLVEER